MWSCPNGKAIQFSAVQFKRATLDERVEIKRESDVIVFGQVLIPLTKGAIYVIY